MVLLRLAVIVPPPDAVGGRNPNDKPTTFMLPVHNPEDITLAQLAARITAQWEKLCPEHP